MRVTVVDGATIGLLKEAGTNIIDLGKLGTDEDAGAEVKLDATLSFGCGDTWVFDSRQQADEMRACRFGLDLNAGYQFGFEVRLTDTTSTARDPHFLSAPRHDGTRHLLVDETCA